MHAAGNKQNKEMLEYLLDHGANVNDQSEWKYTALMNAAGSGNVDSCKFLLEKRADLEMEDHSGYTALCGAVFGEHLDVCKFLVEAKSNLISKDGETPLFYCQPMTKETKKELCEFFLDDCKINLEHEDQWGDTALMNCASRKNLGRCELLVNR